MAKMTHRYPWALAYAYSEVEYDTEAYTAFTDEQMQAQRLAWAQEAVLAEVEYVGAGGGPTQRPMAQEAVAHGAVPATYTPGPGGVPVMAPPPDAFAGLEHQPGYAPPPPQYQQRPQQNQAPSCDRCGAPGNSVQKQWGMVTECSNNQCKDQGKDGRYWPHTIRENAGRR